MRFVNMLYPHRPPRISFTGTVNYAGNNLPDFGSVLCVNVRPQSVDIAKFEALECILNEDDSNPQYKVYADQIKFNGEYEYAPCMDTNLNLNLKLKEGDDGWKFETKLGSTNADIISALYKGVQVDVEVTPGFYFNESRKTFGLYYTVKSIDLAQDVVVRKRK
jgi:hypothetical protein